VRFRRPFLSTAIDFSLALPVTAVIALVSANTLPASYARAAAALEFRVNSGWRSSSASPRKRSSR